MNQKQLWVADFLYRPIAISEIEKAIISTQVFNRLHNILQNSTVYLTYPAIRTSRFSHSLGVMHIAGLIFRHGIINSDESVRKKFFEEILGYLNVFTSSEDFRNQINIHLPNAKDTNLFEYDCRSLDDPLYRSAFPGQYLNKDECFVYLIVFQSIRLVALMHDLGHPPFSHITESAIAKLYDWVATLTSNDKTLNFRQSEFLRIMQSYGGSSRAFHEILGPKLVDRLLVKLIINFKHDDKLCFHVILIRHMVSKILNDDAPVFEGLHGIIEGSIDADRLDYVARDLAMSGLSQNPLYDLDRLVTSFTLTSTKLNNSTGSESSLGFEFTPSVRALSTIEEFFHARFRLYKYVVYHHRVAKTDGLLRDVVYEISRNYLANELSDTSEDFILESGDHRLPTHIFGLWMVLDPKKNILDSQFIDHYIQWDDPWLISVLRKQYFKMQKINNTNEGAMTVDDRLLHLQLEEILSNHKIYHSLIKRADSFKTIDDAFLRSIANSENAWVTLEGKLRFVLGMSGISDDSIVSENKSSETNLLDVNINEQKDSTLSPRLIERLDQIFRILKKYIDVFTASETQPTERNVQRLTDMRETHGFFIVAMSDVLKYRGTGGSSGFPYMTNAMELWQEAQGLEDASISHKQIRPGISGSYQIIKTGNEVIRLGDVSSIAEELTRRSRLVPPFYIFFRRYPKKNIDFEVLQSSLGQYMFNAFHAWIEKSVEARMIDFDGT